MSGASATDPASDAITLTANGVIYSGWTKISVTRSLTSMASSFHVSVTERWAGLNQPWQLPPYTPVVISVGGDPLITGFVDDYDPKLDKKSHGVSLVGRSKTCDLVDCTPDLPSGQFRGYALDAIARSVAAPFGVNVVVTANVGAVFPDASLERQETGHQFLERLARLRSVLLTDDAMGDLVIPLLGVNQSTDAIVQGAGNVLSLGAKLSGAKRFSIYTCKAQSGEGMAAASWNGLGGGTSSAPVAQSPVVTNTVGVAVDPFVPRYRPRTIIAESAVDAAGASQRADWQMRFNAAKSIVAKVTVAGWRQSDGTLWQVNNLTTVTAPYLLLDCQLLIGNVTYTIDDRGGRVTHLELSPVDAYQPDPSKAKVAKNKGKGPAGNIWNGLGGS